MPRLLARVRDAPNVSFTFLGSERFALEDLLHGAVDLVVAAPYDDHPELITRVARRGIGWHLVCDPQRFGRGRVTMKKWLAAEHVQLVPRGQPRVKGEIDRFLAKAGHERRIRAHVADLSVLGEVLRGTSLVCSLPTPTARLLAKTHKVALYPHPMRDRLPKLTLRLNWHVSMQRDMGHRWLRTSVFEAINDALDG